MKKAIFIIICGMYVLFSACQDDPVDETFPLSWRYTKDIAIKAEPGFSVIAPDIVQMDNGTYRMFFGVNQLGICSAISIDGFTWEVEDGVRLANQQVDDEGGFLASHPWVIKTIENTWRMYYQVGHEEASEGEMFIKSAISQDGFTFTSEEGDRLSIYDSMGLKTAAHGRIFLNDDNLYVLIFSGNLIDTHGASDIMLATSEDGLDFTVVNTCLFKGFHDPAVIRLDDGRWVTTIRYLLEESYVSFTTDGLSWTEPIKLSLYDSDGILMTGNKVGLGDPCFMRLPDGSPYIYANTPRSPDEIPEPGTIGIIGVEPIVE